MIGVCLALLIDVSSSVTDASFALQRDASAAAAEQPAILRAGPMIGAVMFASHARVVVPPAPPRAFAAALRQVQRPAAGATGVAFGLRVAVDLLAAMECERRVVDLSGDGRENSGGDVAGEVARAVAAGVEINCLPVVTEAEPDIAEWMDAHVCGPAGGFTLAADWAGYAAALRAKMAAEVAGR